LFILDVFSVVTRVVWSVTDQIDGLDSNPQLASTRCANNPPLLASRIAAVATATDARPLDACRDRLKISKRLHRARQSWPRSAVRAHRVLDEPQRSA